jgi:hypothetical protein
VQKQNPNKHDEMEGGIVTDKEEKKILLRILFV